MLIESRPPIVRYGIAVASVGLALAVASLLPYSAIATDWNEICEGERSYIESRCGGEVVPEHTAKLIWRSLTTPKSSDVDI